MARPRQFDPDQALDQATELFWSKGYEGTSISDLEEHLGLGRQSIYSTFGDKHRLFLAALDRYAARQPAARAPLYRLDAGLQELREFFANLVAYLTEETGRSCMLIKSALEMSEADNAVIRACQDSEKHLLRGLKHALAGAVKRGELAPLDDIDAVALLLASQVYGLNVMSRQGASRATLRRVADRALASLQ